MQNLRDQEGSTSGNSQVASTRPFHTETVTINSEQNLESNYLKVWESN